MDALSELSQASSGFARSTNPASDSPDTTGDFETFLTLLTTQLRNQDPLKPVESTEFVAQLASFSAVEQQVQSNEKLESILEALANGSTGGLAQWIGQQVRNPGSATYENHPMDVQVFVHNDADNAELVIYDENDHIVGRQSIDITSNDIQWSGVLADGSRADAGTPYRFEVISSKDGEELTTTPGLVFSTIQEVRLIDGFTILFFEDGTQMYADDVRAMRSPEPAG